METAFGQVVGVIELAPFSTASRRETASEVEPRTLGDHLQRLAAPWGRLSSLPSAQLDSPTDASSTVAEAEWTDVPLRRWIARRRLPQRFSPAPDRFAAALPADVISLKRRASECLLLADVMQLDADLRRQWTELKSRVSRAR